MEYAAALEERAHAQADHILDLEASVDGQTFFTKTTEYVASAVTAGGNNKDLKELIAMMKQLTASVTVQAAILADLSVKTHSGRESTSRLARVSALQEGSLSQGRKLLGVSSQ